MTVEEGAETYRARKYVFQVHGVEGVRPNNVSVHRDHLLWDLPCGVDPIRPGSNSRGPQPESSLLTHQLVYDFGSVSGRNKKAYII
jgi:hypothetical protein